MRESREHFLGTGIGSDNVPQELVELIRDVPYHDIYGEEMPDVFSQRSRASAPEELGEFI